jgi:hypothetical protein
LGLVLVNEVGGCLCNTINADIIIAEHLWCVYGDITNSDITVDMK